MGLVQTVSPAVEPVTLAEAKAHLRVTSTDEDAMITSLIIAAREYVEQVTRRALVTQTWKLTLDEFPCETFIRLPRPNLQSVTSITYVDTDGATQTLASADYLVDAGSLPGKVDLAYEAEWPDTRAIPNAVSITYVAGYGLAASVPAALKAAILLLVGQWFENREASIDGTFNQIPFAVDALLGPYRAYEAA